ncbi:hypothetical protein GW17_00026596 [Ensete ventricosum]|nr:hypothetical protein GW17_00026596 [Ensete ventricosum]
MFQGLGKTISTIALILMERSPPPKSSSSIGKQDRLEALNLDDDDDGNDNASEIDGPKQPRISSLSVVTGSKRMENSVITVMSRPAAGTLVVCPTSVLRQWAEELKTRVTSRANLSYLVYHGSNRTKDPHELTQYDVVLTTYAIVSMEVPKQPLGGKDDDEKGKPESLMGHTNDKKRKGSPNSMKKCTQSALLESAARPLARVGWFRVILDEAQSIKNYRTQVARACWGLRAKRRWCLSGTPIQNAVDDLYSYFRFLRYDPFATYKSFCSLIKIPISRNPTNGYKKLQAVLKTVMLRRTKGDFNSYYCSGLTGMFIMIDGKPIITLPTKTITLKKVEFSEEERTFYTNLEAESREKFKRQQRSTLCCPLRCMVTVMIMSLKAASLGLNLVAACHVLLLDLWWNPTTEDQAIDRAHRIGQTRPVTVSRLTVKDTVEDRILALQVPGKAPYRAVRTDLPVDRYADFPLPGGTVEIDRRWSISTINGRLREKEDEGETCFAAHYSSPVPSRDPSPVGDSFSPCGEKERGDFICLQEKKREMVASAFGEDESGAGQTRLTVEDLNYLFRV